MRYNLQFFGGRGSGSSGAGGKVTPKGLRYGGSGSEINADANPAKVDKLNDKFQQLAGYSLDEAINEVIDVMQNMDDEFTLDYLKEKLPKMRDATLSMRDAKEIADIALR